MVGGGKAEGILGATGQSPADALALLRKVGSVTEVGTETIDGAQTTHYRATVDVAEALENAGAPAEAARRGARERPRDEGPGRRVGRRRRLRPQAARRLQHRPPAARASAAS